MSVTSLFSAVIHVFLYERSTNEILVDNFNLHIFRLCGHVSTNNATPIEERNGDLHQNSAAAADIEEHDDVQNSNTNSTDILIHT